MNWTSKVFKSLFIVALFLFSVAALTQDTRLHLAVMEGDRESVGVFLGDGADVNARMNGGWTPLMVGAKYGRLNIMRDLLRVNAQINLIDDSGNTALILAVLARREKEVKLLLDFSADANIVNKEGMTALDIARMMDSTPIFNMVNNYVNQGLLSQKG